MRRARGSGGRFAKKTGADTSNTAAKDKDTGSGPAHSSMSASSSGSEPFVSDSNETWNSSNFQQEGIRMQVNDENAAQNYVNESSYYLNQGVVQSSTYHMHSGESSEEGDCSGQQRGSISSNQVAQQRLAIQ